MAVEILRLPDAWLPDDEDGDVANVDVYVEDEALVLMVLEDDTGQIRIALDELNELLEFVERVLGVDPTRQTNGMGKEGQDGQICG